jgi:hypothetical protein
MLDSISYCSRGIPDLDGESFRQIISVARRNNAIHGITGLLVFGGGLYFQWLEGPPKALQNVMAKICQDPRHDSLVILGNNSNEPERVFPNWDMEPVGPEQIHEVLVDAIGSIKTETNGALLELLLDHIRRVDGALQ